MKQGIMSIRLLAFFVCVLITLSSCVFIGLPSSDKPLEEVAISGAGKDKILVIDISGVIRNKQKKRFGFSEPPSLTSRIREELDKASEDPRIKGLILRIDTPGGEVTTTDIIHHEIKKYKEKKKIFVLAELMDVAASGGYYIATSADTIVAHPTTVTGAIGVVAYRVNATGLIEKIGLTNETIKTGDKKDMGSPLRPVTDEEREIMQGVVDGLFVRFLQAVREGRGLDEKGIEAIKDGRIYTAPEAIERGLVDSIGYMDDAVDIVKKKTGIKDARVITYSRGGSRKSNIYSGALSTGGSAQFNLVNIDGSLVAGTLGFRFMFLWMP